MTTQSTVNHETNSPTAHKLATGVHAAADAIETSVPEMKAKLRNLVDSGKTHVTEWKGGFQEGIREKPIQSVLIAAAVGTVIGLLIGRRSS
jgi:ElaB/YqjD/DUF883 family membrane-anchored ribosome-binding protein